MQIIGNGINLKKSVELAWPDKTNLKTVSLAELSSQLTWPTSHCGDKCHSPTLRKQYTAQVEAAIAVATSPEDLCSRLHEIRI